MKITFQWKNPDQFYIEHSPHKKKKVFIWEKLEFVKHELFKYDEVQFICLLDFNATLHKKSSRGLVWNGTSLIHLNQIVTYYMAD